jgi:two-component system, NarL family, response regulator DevR
MNPRTDSPATLVIVDDSELVRTGLRTLLGACPAIRILGEAATVAEGIARIQALRPEVALLDIRLPDGTGFDLCAALPDPPDGPRVLFLTSVVDDSLIARAIESGASGYLLKEIDGRGLERAILDVAAGRSILDPEVTARVMRLARQGGPADPLTVLSPQEKRVLALIAEGRTNKEVASDLDLSEKTVKNYVANIFDKLNVTRRSQAVALFVTARR